MDSSKKDLGLDQGRPSPTTKRQGREVAAGQSQPALTSSSPRIIAPRPASRLRLELQTAAADADRASSSPLNSRAFARDLRHCRRLFAGAWVAHKPTKDRATMPGPQRLLKSSLLFHPPYEKPMTYVPIFSPKWPFSATC